MPTTQESPVNALQVTKETGPIFQENWFDTGAVQGLQSLVQRTQHLTGAIIEVGSWEGRSTIALAQAAYPAKVYAIDNWLGNANEDLAIQERAARGEEPEGSRHPTTVEIEIHGRDVYQRFLDNIAVATDGNIIPKKMNWREFFADFHDPIRLMFVDGDHTYEEVRDNILAALPLLQPGGILCGDDCGVPGVHRAIVETLGGYLHNGVWWWQKEL